MYTLDGVAPVGPGARALTIDRSGERIWLATDAAMWKTDPALPDWLEWWKVTKVRAIAADETAVFVARDGEPGILRFGREDPAGAMPTALAPMAPPPWALVEDGAFLFYTAIEQGVVVKVAKDGTAVKPLAAGLERPKGIAVRLDKVYVALGDGRIVAIPH
jgi:hypothetical protein